MQSIRHAQSLIRTYISPVQILSQDQTVIRFSNSFCVPTPSFRQFVRSFVRSSCTHARCSLGISRYPIQQLILRLKMCTLGNYLVGTDMNVFACFILLLLGASSVVIARAALSLGVLLASTFPVASFLLLISVRFFFLIRNILRLSIVLLVVLGVIQTRNFLLVDYHRKGFILEYINLAEST